MNAIILCGGLSTRLGEITKSIPKILLEIGDKTVLDWQLEKLKNVGIDKVVMAAGHLSEVLQKEVGEERNGVKIIYAVEKEKLGTGGAVKFAMDFVPEKNEPTVVLNGDILTTVDFTEMVHHLNRESDGIILGTKVEDASTYEILKYDENRLLLEFVKRDGIKKVGYINGGFYVFTPQIKKYFPDTNSFSMEYDVFPHMKNLYVYQSDRPWIDIGVPERLEWARQNWQTFAS